MPGRICWAQKSETQTCGAKHLKTIWNIKKEIQRHIVLVRVMRTLPTFWVGYAQGSQPNSIRIWTRGAVVLCCFAWWGLFVFWEFRETIQNNNFSAAKTCRTFSFFEGFHKSVHQRMFSTQRWSRFNHCPHLKLKMSVVFCWNENFIWQNLGNHFQLSAGWQCWQTNISLMCFTDGYQTHQRIGKCMVSTAAPSMAFLSFLCWGAETQPRFSGSFATGRRANGSTRRCCRSAVLDTFETTTVLLWNPAASFNLFDWF